MGNCGNRSEEKWQIHYPGNLHGQDPLEASNQSWETRDFRQDANCESKACKDSCQSLPSGCLEEKHLKQIGAQFPRASLCSLTVVFRVAGIHGSDCKGIGNA